MGRAGSGQDAWLLWVKLVGAAAAFAIAAEGCGAATDISDVGDFGSSFGGSRNGTGGQGFAGNQAFGGRPVGALCGDGQLEDGEACDGQDFHGQTCASATNGALTQGVLTCANCELDYRNCIGAGGFNAGGSFNAGGNFNAGGRFNAGGGVGFGGFGAFGGFFPDASVGAGGTAADSCYSEGGVPDPSSSGLCDFGDMAIKACLVDYEQRQGNGGCSAVCACQSCASSYDRCTALPGCLDFVTCANGYGCTNLANCANGLLCGVSVPGGITQATVSTLDDALSCATSAGCCQFVSPP